MFWGQERQDYGRFLTGVRISHDEAVIRIGDNWLPTLRFDPESLVKMSDADIAAYAGMPLETFQGLVTDCLQQWRESPSRSPINILANIGHAAGAPLFATLKQQTAALIALAQAGILNLNRGGPIRAVINPDGKRAMVSHDAPMVSLSEEGYETLGKAATALRLWEQRNAARVSLGLVKLPKKLYRGIRLASLKVPFDAASGASYPVRHCTHVAAALAHIASNELSRISGTPLLSFTANRSVAEYFTRNEGFVVEIEPQDAGVVSSWATDAGLAGSDPLTGKQEREWIMRLPPGMTLSPEQVDVQDYEWLRSFADHRAIGMIQHYDVADYRLEGRSVRASFSYNSNGVGGRPKFCINNGWPMSRRQVQKDMGFDPLPDDARPPEELVFRYRDPYLPHSNHDYDRLDMADFNPVLAGSAPSM